MDFNLFKNIKTRYLFIAMTAVTIISSIALVFIEAALRLGFSNDYAEVYSLIVTLAWFVMALVFVRKKNISMKSFLGKFPKKSFVLEVPLTWIITYIGALGAILILYFMVSKLTPNLLSSVQSNVEEQPTILSNNIFVVISFLGTVVAAPIVEEFIFRGILFRRLYSKFGIIIGILLSSLIFFLLHFTINFIIFFLGMALAILTYKYKSLVPAICLHALNNCITFFIERAKSSSNATTSSDSLVSTATLIVGIIFFIMYLVFLILNLRKCYKIKVLSEE
ncbi:CPBP family intramembrane glutamic endopeptidase [Clostridium felsineum]|uniref:CPBP family intramembrane glutamic endopeptidase n=1 Tax=Clostridium felsineum TaxID=36839 RepID=UPI00098CB663|nr:CPBP family intramembrane glutamic endopeptidase [Clostridium felsineum]URZ17068.1 hypothetical protein CLFE_031200 [Clostridium felsineum DSM 794]